VSYQCAREVDACCPGVAAVKPCRLWKAEQALGRHFDASKVAVYRIRLCEVVILGTGRWE
jgi:hypothetical protein